VTSSHPNQLADMCTYLRDTTLENEERQSSDQIVVAVFPKMQSDASVKNFTLRIVNSWKVGQKDQNNGVTLFVFMQEHKLYIQVGTGLEKFLPDDTCQEILDAKIVPRFKLKDFDGGLSAGVTAIIGATKGAFKGTGHTAKESHTAIKNAPVPNPVGQ
jgi:uncharacterized protein